MRHVKPINALFASVLWASSVCFSGVSYAENHELPAISSPHSQQDSTTDKLTTPPPSSRAFILGNRFIGSPDLTNSDRRMGYITRDISQELLSRMGLKLESTACPFKRCIASLRSGKVDLMLLLRTAQERQKDLHFIQIWPNTLNVVFFIRKGETSNIQRYEDLYEKTIGLVNGYAYFPRFDKDPLITPTRVTTPQQLPKLLLANRIDAFASYENLADDILKQYPGFEKAPFKASYGSIAMFAISKKSPLASRLKEIDTIALEMIQDGTLDKISNKHIKGLRFPYPTHLNQHATETGDTEPNESLQ